MICGGDPLRKQHIISVVPWIPAVARFLNFFLAIHTHGYKTHPHI